jgi:hypothetical protein
MAASLHYNYDTGLKMPVLDLVHLPSPHTAEKILRKYVEILSRHRLNPSDIFKVVSDNASSMQKAFKVKQNTTVKNVFSGRCNCFE